jgi:hypothetical protein
MQLAKPLLLFKTKYDPKVKHLVASFGVEARFKLPEGKQGKWSSGLDRTFAVAGSLAKRSKVSPPSGLEVATLSIFYSLVLTI